jgi:ABC-2 type transport system permease protein
VSAAEAPSQVPPDATSVGRQELPPGRSRGLSTRFLRSELKLIFGRRRNIAGMAVLAAVPIIIAFAVKYSGSRRGGGGGVDGGGFIGQATNNGLFVGLVALTVELPLFLPLAVAVIAGDAVAGEANVGTLRYLLARPVQRTRLLAVKYLGVLISTVVAVLLVAVVGVGFGLALFGAGPVTLLSGTQVSTGVGLWRLLLVCGYLVICLAAFGAIGLFASTLTEQPIGATIAVVGLALLSQILDSVSQLSAIHPYLPTHYWLSFGDLLRDPISTDQIVPGIVSAVVYTVIFLAAAWARFGSKDITS